jgi:hypothetical protein
MLRLDDPTEFKPPYRFGWKSADPKHYSVKLTTGSTKGGQGTIVYKLTESSSS